MEITLKDAIYIKNPTEQIRRWCAENLVLANPDFLKKEAMGKWTGGTPRTLNLFERRSECLVLPFGCLRDVWGMCKNEVWSVQISPVRRCLYESNIELYPYQEKAVNEALKRKNGILIMPCGAGKTQSGLEIISRISGRALWLTHTQDLLNQSKSRAESVLSGISIGTITGGKVNIGNHITFATVQTMATLDLSKYRDEWDIIVVDECQHCCGSPTRVTQFYKVVNSLSARYKYGLTATLKRADGLERGVTALLGDVIHEVSRAEVAETTCPIKVEAIETGWTPDYDCVLMGDGTIDYNKVIEAMTSDADRKEVVFEKVTECASRGATLVLANRVQYLRDLADRYGGRSVCLSGMGQSKKAKAERKEVLRKLNCGELDCVFATYQLAKEGLDVPNLRYVILATPEKDETTVVQSAGRVGRKSEGKEYGVVVDFVDDFGMYRGWAKKRSGYYKKIGAEIS